MALIKQKSTPAWLRIVANLVMLASSFAFWLIFPVFFLLQFPDSRIIEWLRWVADRVPAGIYIILGLIWLLGFIIWFISAKAALDLSGDTGDKDHRLD